MLIKFWKVIKLIVRKIHFLLSTTITQCLFRLNGIRFGCGLRAIGIPSVNVSLGGNAVIGKRFYLRTGLGSTEVGTVGTRIRVGRNGILKIGNRVGMSNTTIVCQNAVTIGDDVFIGGGVQIFDTNFHATDADVRISGQERFAHVRTNPVTIGNRVFLGANVIVCKGVSIGDEAIVAAGAVVAQSIPSGEVWAGNPARKVR